MVICDSIYLALGTYPLKSLFAGIVNLSAVLIMLFSYKFKLMQSPILTVPYLKVWCCLSSGIHFTYVCLPYKCFSKSTLHQLTCNVLWAIKTTSQFVWPLVLKQNLVKFPCNIFCIYPVIHKKYIFSDSYRNLYSSHPLNLSAYFFLPILLCSSHLLPQLLGPAQDKPVKTCAFSWSRHTIRSLKHNLKHNSKAWVNKKGLQLTAKNHRQDV